MKSTVTSTYIHSETFLSGFKLHVALLSGQRSTLKNHTILKVNAGGDTNKIKRDRLFIYRIYPILLFVPVLIIQT